MNSKKLLSILLIACMLFSIMPVAAFADEATPEIWVGGVGMVSGDYLHEGATAVSAAAPTDSSVGYAYYEDGVLTLKNYDYSGKGAKIWEENFLIARLNPENYLAELDLQIVYEGTNKLTEVAGDDQYYSGICTTGDLTLTAKDDSASLEVTAESGLLAAKEVTISGGTVIVKSDNSAIKAGTDLTITDSTVTAVADEYALYAKNVAVSGESYVDAKITRFPGSFWAIRYAHVDSEGTFTYDGLNIQAAKDPEGELGEYKSGNSHNGYGRIVISPASGGTEPEPNKYNVWVLGTQVTSANASDVLNDSKVSYDPVTNTLTIYDDLHADTGKAIMAATEDKLNIKLEKKVTISNSTDDNTILSVNGIKIDAANYDVTLTNTKGAVTVFTPNGSFDVNTNGTFTSNGSINCKEIDIQAQNDVIVNGFVTKYGSINSKGGNVSIISTSSNAVTAVGGSFNITAGNAINIESQVSEGNTITGDASVVLNAGGDITVDSKNGIAVGSGGSFTAKSTAGAFRSNGSISCPKGIDIQAKKDVIVNGVIANNSSDTGCIESKNGKVSIISNGSTAITGNAGVVLNAYGDITVDSKNGTAVVSGGSFTAKSIGGAFTSNGSIICPGIDIQAQKDVIVNGIVTKYGSETPSGIKSESGSVSIISTDSNAVTATGSSFNITAGNAINIESQGSDRSTITGDADMVLNAGGDITVKNAVGSAVYLEDLKIIGQNVLIIGAPVGANKEPALTFFYENINGNGFNVFEGASIDTLSVVANKAAGETYSSDMDVNVIKITASKPSSGSGGGFSGVYNYPVIVGDTDGADVAVSDDYAVKGEKITITVKPDAGEQVDEVIVTDKDGKVIPVTKTGDNEYTFTMPASKVTVNVTTEAADYDLRIVMQINNKNILVNGKTMVNDVAPVIVGDRTLVPIRVVTELLGGSADWDDATRTVTLHIDGKVLSMTIGKPIPGFGTSAVIMNDRTYVPVRYVMEMLGAEVEWIAATQQIIIEK